MASTTAVSLATLVDEALATLYRSTERPAQLLVGSNSLTADSSDTTFTVTGDSTLITNLQSPTVVECGQEQMLLTAKSADATPVFTVSRGYNATPLAAHATGAILLISPLWGRFDVRRQVIRGLQGTIANQLPSITSAVITPTSGQLYAEAPANCMSGLRLSYTQVGAANVTPILKWEDISEWGFVEDVPTSVSSTGKLLTFPSWVAQLSTNVSLVTTLYFTYQAPYAWSAGTNDPAESETVDLPQGAQDLPSLYASCMLGTGREFTRLQLDKVEEWMNSPGANPGASTSATLRLLWQEFYRRLDEARRMQTVPRHRPFRAMRRI